MRQANKIDVDFGLGLKRIAIQDVKLSRLVAQCGTTIAGFLRDFARTRQASKVRRNASRFYGAREPLQSDPATRLAHKHPEALPRFI